MISGTTDSYEVTLMAKAAVCGDALAVRASAMELMGRSLAQISSPANLSSLELCVAAGIVELLAERSGQPAPAWTAAVPAAAEAFYLVRSAHRLPRLKLQCEQESPVMLKKRNLFAPANYLRFA